jgi:hypothetical protein
MAGTDVDKVIKTLQDLELDDESDCHVYLLVEKNDDDPSGKKNYKVGRSGNPGVRITNLQTGNPRKLEFVPDCKIEVEDGPVAEQAAKEALKGYKCKLGGGTEWFTAQTRQEKAKLIETYKNAVEPHKKI